MVLHRTRYIAPTRPKGIGKEKDGISIIILCSSAGHRMKSYGAKCLLKDKYGVSLLQNQIDIFSIVYPLSEFILIGGFELDKIIKNKPSNVRIVENQLFEESNEIEEARLGIINSLYDNVIFTYGDLFFDLSVIQNFSNKSSSIIAENNHSMLNEDVGITVVDNNATIMSFGIETPKWGRLAFLTGQELKYFKQFCFNRDNRKLYLFEGLNNVLARDGKLKVQFVSPSQRIIHIDSPKELAKIQ